MKIESKLNKIYASLIAIMFIAIAISSVFAVRTITNTGDNVDTFIRNSKGNYWSATGANLQLAIYDLANLSGTVWMPAGTIYLTSVLYVGSNCHLMGAGMYQTTLKKGTATVIYNVITMYYKNNTILSDFTFNGNNTYSGGGATNDIAIDMRKCRNMMIQNVRVINPAGEGLYVEATGGYTWGCKNLTIDNYICRNVQAATAHHGMTLGYLYNGTIRNVDISGVYVIGDGIDMGEVHNTTFDNIRITNTTADGWKMNTNCDHITVTKVRMDNIGNGSATLNNIGIKIAGANLRYLTFSDIDMKVKRKGFYIYATTGYPILINDFHIVSDAVGIDMAGSTPFQKNITISNGEITCDDTGIYLYNTRNATVSNVKILSTKYYGIRGAGCFDTNIIDCSVLRSSAADTYLGLIKFHDCNRTTVIGCNLEKSVSWGIYSDGCRNLTIQGNSISHCIASGYGGINCLNTSGFIISNNRIIGNHESILLMNTYCNNFIIIGNYISSCTHAFDNCTGATLAIVKHNLNNGAYLDS